MESLTVELLVDDFDKTIQWYQSTLDFKIVSISPDSTNPTFARLKKGSVEIMFYHRSEFALEIPTFEDIRIGGSMALYLVVDDIQSIWDIVQDKTKVIQPLHPTNYGSKEFTILDCNGYHLMFGERSA